MKTKFTLLLVLVGFHFYAQNAVWVQQGKSANNERGNDLAQDNSGNIYVTGDFFNSVTFETTTLTDPSGKYCAKYNPNGNLIWAISGVGQNGITFDGNSNLYLYSNFNSSLQKIDLNGNVVWNNTLFTSSTFGSVGIQDVFVKGNDVYVTGFYSGNANFGTTTLLNTNETDGNWDIFIAKYNANGVFQWAKTAGGTGLDKGYGIYVNSADEIYTIGYFRNTANFGTASLVSNGNSDIYLTKYDSTGITIWAKKFGSSGLDLAAKIIAAEGDNLLITGRFNGFVSFDSVELEAVGTDAFIAKLDSSGNIIWAKKISGQGNDEEADIFYDGTNISFISTTNGNVTIGTNTFSQGGALDICLGKMDNSGNLIWGKVYASSADDEGSGISYYNGAVYFTGSFKSTGTFDTLSLTSLGNWDAVTGKIDDNLSTHNFDNALFNDFYPNPTNDILYIDYTLYTSSKISIRVTNIQGQINNEIKVDRNSGFQTETIDLSNQASGMYFITITTENSSFTSKVIKQ